MIWEADDDSFRRDIFLKALKALDYYSYVIQLSSLEMLPKFPPTHFLINP